MQLFRPFDHVVMAIVNQLSNSQAELSVSMLARTAGISSRQLQRRFLATVGVPPKRFVRVIRFAQVWRLASMHPRGTWADLADDNGYADQAHMVREFRAFGAEPPTHLFSRDWYNATKLSRLTGPASGVRSVQDSRAKLKQ